MTRRVDPATRARWELNKPRDLSQDQIKALRDAQGGDCPICSMELDSGSGRQVVDHCHRTGRVRALVHEICNIRLGYVERLMRGGARFRSEEILMQFPTGWVSECLRFLGVRAPSPMVRYGELTPAQLFRALMVKAGLNTRQAAAELDLSARLVKAYADGTHPPPRAAILALERLAQLQREVR